MKKLPAILAVLLLGITNVFSQEQTKTLYDVYLERGNDAYENGNYESALDWTTKASEYAKNIFGEISPEYASSLNELAVCYDSLGSYTIAIELYKQALKIYKITRRESHLDYATTLRNLGDSYHSLGDYITAIELQIQALEITGTLLGKNHPEYAISLNNLSSVFYSIGDYTTATELLKQTLEIYENLGESHYAYAISLSNLADCYSRIGDYPTAIELYQLALEIKVTSLGESHPTYATTLNNLADCFFGLGDYITALDLLKQTLEIRELALGKNHPEYIISLGNLSICYFEAKQFNQIKSIWAEEYGITKTHAISQFRELTSTQRQMYWETQILPSIVVSNNLYTKVLSDDNQSMGLSYNSLLFSKGVILASDIEFDKVIRESGDTVLLEKFEELRTTRAILNTYYNKPIAERPEGEVERLEARAEVLEKDLLAGSKEYADFTRRLEIEWQDVQTALGDKDVAIEILAADEHIDEDTPPYYAALVLRKGWDAPKFVEMCGAEELQAYFDGESGLAMMYREANSRKLYDLIWGKLAEYINEGDNVYFSPGGLLHQVNVELLQDTDGRLANEKYNLHRVSSTRELCFEKPKIAHSEAVLYGGLRYDLDSTTMIAQSRAVRPEEEHYALRGLQLDSLRGKLNYLSASKTEVEKISKQMNQHGIKTTLYVEQVGNEESFKALSGKKTPIIHLATHGFFFKNEEAKVKPFFRMMSMDQERPRPDNSLRRSGLAFAGAQKAWDGEEIPKGIDDGVMLAQEIASMDLVRTDLVVLSACETGLGEINGEGVFGLQRAFKKAGVQTLIMSLWKVHDEATALFMRTFYDNLLSGKSKRDSFAAAQMALRKHRDYGKDPAYWAAFVMLD